jgi:hypothetical protein
MDLENVNGTWTWNMDMEHGHAKKTWNVECGEREHRLGTWGHGT